MCALNITPYERRHRRAADTLFNETGLVFMHLDWHTIDQLLTSPHHLIYLAWQQTTPVGLMGLSLPVNGACWLRLIALDDRVEPLPILTALWHVISLQVLTSHAHMIGALQVEDWLADFLHQLGFKRRDNVITFMLDTRTLPLRPANPTVIIRPAFSSDMWAVLDVDWRAFAPPWQLSSEDMRQARRLSANHSVALLDDHIVGYQLSTTYQQQGHLARLAVLPELQGLGIGAALVTDMIQRFARREIWMITVNTQATNNVSRRLYARLGFERTNHDMPFWQYDIDAPPNESDTA